MDRMPTPTRHLARALKAWCALALLAAAAIVATPRHPPERIVTSSATPFADEATPVTQNRPAPQPVPPPPPPATRPLDPTPRVWPSGDGRAAIAAHFGDVYGQAVAVARCESGLDPGAVSSDGRNWGLMQINSVHARSWTNVTGRDFWSSWMIADLNAQFARWLYNQSGGWGPWACKP